jgi:hypothetical protein
VRQQPILLSLWRNQAFEIRWVDFLRKEKRGIGFAPTHHNYLPSVAGPGADMERSGLVVEVKSIELRVLTGPSRDQGGADPRTYQIDCLTEALTNRLAVAVVFYASLKIIGRLADALGTEPTEFLRPIPKRPKRSS